MNKKNNPLVSICCITYNHQDYIQDAIEGFLKQEVDFPIEIIIHDDASTDNTAGIIRKYEREYPDLLRPIYQSENQYSKGNTPITAKFILPKVRGKYVALCEGDDYWTDPKKIERQVNFLENNSGYVGCFTNFSVVNSSGNVIKRKGLSPNKRRDLDISLILEFQTPKTLTTIFRSEVLPKRYPIEYSKVVNGDTFLFSMVARHNPFKYLDFVSGVYRSHEDGIWGEVKTISRKEKQLQSFFYMSRFFDEKKEQIAIKNRINRKRKQLFALYVNNMKLLKAFRMLLKIKELENESYIRTIKFALKQILKRQKS